MSDITDSDIYNFITNILKKNKYLLTNEEVLKIINNERNEKLLPYEIENLYTQTFTVMKDSAKEKSVFKTEYKTNYNNAFTTFRRLMLYNLMIKYPGAHANFFINELKFKSDGDYYKFYNNFKKEAASHLPKAQKKLFIIHEKLKTNYAYYLIKCVAVKGTSGNAVLRCVQDEIDSLDLRKIAGNTFPNAKLDIQSLINQGIKTIKIYNDNKNSMQEVNLIEVLKKLKS